MTAPLFDESNEVHAKALAMLARDRIAWIVTTTAGGEPRAVPVWFYWHDGRVSILSKPDAHKVAHVRRGSPVLIHLHAGGEFGDDVVVLRGKARISEQSTADWITEFREPYEAKYAEAIVAYGSPIDEIVATFSSVIEFTPEHVLAW